MRNKQPNQPQAPASHVTTLQLLSPTGGEVICGAAGYGYTRHVLYMMYSTLTNTPGYYCPSM